MLARRAGLLDWDRRSIRWALVAVVCALFVGVLADRSVTREMQAADAAAVAAGEPA